ncbi:cardiolipin synthase [Pseudodesulfovibrio piezophilus]|uniref:Cardiolipin synthase n=1 Tax=Pseudodesulfovibrio piezophilus (strain DSM 21447 / JCM 15486 / C1TLV30) TaxID=1322246 RepID=M1WUM1_PSEP2|nr:cardiolipin synthase [Pseudodesulfovibrio piezophilus]CCH47578.1 Cardiolipin synthase [Pseudodesulfovibrio piezophilus C1TLV30]
MNSTDLNYLFTALSIAYTALEIGAIATAILAVRDTRTPQGAVAWALSLISIPFIALPLYWVFGRSKFHGYVEIMRARKIRYLKKISKNNIPTIKGLSERLSPHAPRCAFETLAEIPFLEGNDVALLVDGVTTFDAIISSIKSAQDSICLQFFIVRSDQLGKRLQKALIDKAASGISIRFLYDEVGCGPTPSSYWKKMQDVGIQAHSFHSTKGPGNRFQLNFRNHRKIVIIDGCTAFVGGHNVGDEYLGQTNKFKGWRDTHLKITGPAVLGIKISFAKDWYWATHELHEHDLAMPERAGDVDVLALATGPADDLESCSLMFIRAINAAKKRFWIASPYYVPDSSVTKALQLAAMRGVDIRIILPQKADHLLVYLAGFACLNDLRLPGIRIYRYHAGFLHQKVFLVDDTIAGIGTANLDNRSFRLNFEITMLVENQTFCQQVEGMFEADFARCKETDTLEYNRKNIISQTVIRFARLLSPIL